MEIGVEWLKTVLGWLIVAALALYLWHRPSGRAIEWALKTVLSWLIMVALALYLLHRGLPSQP
jgi:hypothetical protein